MRRSSTCTRAALGSGFTKLFLVAALIAVFSTAVATLATIVRMIYGMARNGQLPGGAFLTKLSGRTTEPTGAIIVSSIERLFRSFMIALSMPGY